MNNELKPFKEYKETDLSWINKIPHHWNWLYLSQVCEEKQIKNSDNVLYNVLSLSYGNIIRKKNIDFGLVPKEYSNYQIVNGGNIILRLTDLQNDKRSLRTGLVKEKGIITSAYVCLKVKRDINPSFVHYLLHSYDTIKVFYGMGGGVRQSIGFNDIRKLKLPVPSRTEQDKIVKYLDWQLARINKFINTKKKLVLALKEQKQAFINETVSNGINRNVKKKSSGIDWLGDIPEHWKVRKLKYLGKFINGYAFPSDKFTAEGVRVIKISNIQTMNIDWTDESFVDESYYWERSGYRVMNGDLVLALTRPIISTGIKASFVYSNDRILLNQRTALFRAREELSPSWLYYVIFNSDFIQTFDQKIDKTGQQPNISTIDIQNISIPLPSVEEQQEIVIYLESKINVIDNGISVIEQEINLITEYRNRLISDVVTGKVDVRDIVVGEVDRVEVDIEDIEEELDDNDEVADSEECEV